MGDAHFIVFEGIDGSGSTTQVALLAGWYEAQGLAARVTSEPSSGPIGALLRLALSRRVGLPPSPGGRGRRGPFSAHRRLGEATMALLFAADRLDHLESEVEPYLAAGTTVICDRYYLSSLAYQGADPHLTLDWVKQVNALARAPDLTILLDVPVDVGQERITKRRLPYELYETPRRLDEVRGNYLRLARERTAAGERIVTVDGSRSEAEVHAEVLIVVEDLRASAA